MKKMIIKGLIAIISFIVILMLIQPVFTPKFVGEATTMIDGLKQLDNKNIDLLFLGSSQMFCAVDARSLTDDYHLSTYNYGASNQCLSITEYYLNEALKQCRPKIVLVETGNVFYTGDGTDDTALTWNYAPTDMSIAKFRSVLNTTNDYVKSAEHAFFPVFLYHSRWNEISSNDADYYKKYFNSETYENRGFTERAEIVPQTMLYNSNDTGNYSIPDENKQAIMNMVDTCNKEGIRIIFFKLPVPFWTKARSDIMKSFANENKLEYVDFFDYLDEFDLDEKNDFRDDHHANIYGAKKITDFIGNHLSVDGFDID